MTENDRKKRFRIEPLPAGLSPRSIHVVIATWFGSGRLRPAPGTIGTLASLPFGYAIAFVAGIPGLIVASLLLLWAGTKAADVYGTASGKKDDQSIVVDETVGVWIAAIPAGINVDLWIAAFLLFRFFDIYKPWPASFFDKRCKGGFDVMMDDVVAGVFAMLGVASLALLYLY